MIAVQNPNAIWFQRQGSFFAQVMRTGNERYSFELYSLFEYPRWSAHPQSGKLLFKGALPKFSVARKVVLKWLTSKTAS